MRSNITGILLNALALLAAAAAGILLLRALSLLTLVFLVSSQNRVLVACSGLLYNERAIGSPLWLHSIDILSCLTASIFLGFVVQMIISPPGPIQSQTQRNLEGGCR